MLRTAKRTLFAALLAGVAMPAIAADIMEPQIIEAPLPQQVSYAEPSYGSWYIRGDVDYHSPKMRGADYTLYNPPFVSNSFDFTDLRGAMSLGAGIGYQANKYFRTDLTADYWFKSKFEGQTTGFCGNGPCQSVDESSMTAMLLLANAYADLGTYGGITPYVGAGIGGAHVKWDNLRNTIGGTTTEHEGSKNWRFAYAVMAGASYCLTSNLQLDAGYRFSHINGGKMFEYANGGGPGYDKGFNTHEVRGGLRYSFGGANPNCSESVAAYEPPAIEPVYK
ncbi:outer membrane beta-barrel protein [Mesorhizobium sp. NBSH29]|uniref:outer membrane protein n=1 Tax=Mesorhizobium sp. NBSH29 TaxID=2654249 RepID=UPI001896710E|nr:outer membrane protein [Mesorhizobium sp. NBSH29]QPC85777.1 outer membrane beta-barrel protein [Mesorhizobium sp. NBSH29]